MQRYLFLTATIFLLLTMGVVAFNFFVDPLLLYHHRNGGSEELGRIEQFHNMRLYKPLHVNSIKTDAIIIGSSRTGNIEPENALWKDFNGYNFSLPGMTINELSRSVKHAHANQPLSRLMIGLDFGAILSVDPIYRSGFEPARMATTAADFYSFSYIWQRILDLQATLLSMEITSDSILALSETTPKIRQYRPDGSWEAVSNRLTGRGGYVYVAKNEILESRKTSLQPEKNLAALYELLDFCYRNNIETRLFFTPMHVFFTDLWLLIAPQDLWRSTHRNVVKLNAELAEKHGRPPFEIWGFDNEKQVVAEPIYRARDIEQAWFNDGLHYRAKLADAIMTSMWSTADNFGQILTSDTIDGYLDTVDSHRQFFMQENETTVREIQEKIGLRQ